MGCVTAERDSIVSSKEEFATLLRMLTNNDDIVTKATIRKPRRRVRFSSSVSSTIVDQKKQNNELTDEDIQRLWYDGKTISNFRNNAIKMVSSLWNNKLRGEEDQQQQEQQTTTTETTRGLERWALPRQHHRHKTVQCIVSGHKKGMSSNQTMMMSQRCSSWNVEIALFQACHDYYEVHEQPGVSPLPFELNTPPPFPFEMTRIKKRTMMKSEKRKGGTTGDENNSSSQSGSRRVRRRTML